MMTVDEEYLQKVIRTVAHDISASLRAASGFSQLIINQYAEQLDDKALQWLSLMKQEGDKAQDQLLALSRYARLYGIEDKCNACDLTRLCQQAMRDPSYNDMTNNNLVFHVDIGNLPTIEGYERLWHMYFLEIIGNSIKYSLHKPVKCKVYSQLREHWLDIIIEDNGVGMTLKQIEKAQLPYQVLAEGIANKNNPSVGIGMSIAKRIVELHGGQFIVEPCVAEDIHNSHTVKLDSANGLRVIASIPVSC